MKYRIIAHRYADAIIEHDPTLKARYDEFISVLDSITDDELKEKYDELKEKHKKKNTNFKSLAPCINELIKEKMAPLLRTSDTDSAHYWEGEVDIFNADKEELGNTEWRLDFASVDGLAVEVAFNHGEAIAWNLLKPCLASELNHVKKKIQTRLGIYVCATDDLKLNGNLDGATGAFEKVERYLKPMMNQLVTPMIIIGLEAPETFHISQDKREAADGKNIKPIIAERKKKLIEYLEDNKIKYVKSSAISINKYKTSVSIKVPDKKVAFLNDDHDNVGIGLLGSKGWTVFILSCFDDDNVYNDAIDSLK